MAMTNNFKKNICKGPTRGHCDIGDHYTTPCVEIQTSKEQGMVPALALATLALAILALATLALAMVPAMASPLGPLPHTEGVQVLPEDLRYT